MRIPMALVAVAIPALVAAQDQAAFDGPACVKAAWENPRSSLVSTRFGYGLDVKPLALLASKERANPREKESVAFLADSLQECTKKHQPIRETYVKPQKDMIIEFERSTLAFLTKLYNGDSTWGEAVTAREDAKRLYDQRVEEWAAEKARLNLAIQQYLADKNRREQAAAEERSRAIEAEMRQREWMEAERRRAASNDLINTLGAIQAMQPRPPAFAPQINCRSTQFGNTVQTRCN